MTAKIAGPNLGPANGTKINYYDRRQALVDNTDQCGVRHQQWSCTRNMRSSRKKLWKPISQKLWICGCSNLDFWIVLFTTGNEISTFESAYSTPFASNLKYKMQYIFTFSNAWKSAFETMLIVFLSKSYIVFMCGTWRLDNIWLRSVMCGSNWW